MRKYLLVALAILSVATIYAQEITGDWNGVLNVQGMKLRLVLHVAKEGEGYQSTLDSPDQNASGIPVSMTAFENNELIFQVSKLGVDYAGTLGEGEIIKGTFKQMGQTFPLDFTREAQEKQAVVRPQEPKPPFPYYEEEVSFPSEGDIKIAGTLTLPKKEGKFPLAILISGSGPQNRNEELMFHKPFLVLADHLTRNGIAVLRCDDRGVGKSTGHFETATTQDFAKDVRSAMAYAMTRKEIIKTKIGLIGHSEGGLIAPMVASTSAGVGFIILLAGPGLPGDKVLTEQIGLISKAQGMSADAIQFQQRLSTGAFDIIKNSSADSVETNLKAYFNKVIDEVPDLLTYASMDREVFINTQLTRLNSPWIKYFLRYDPAPALKKVKCPVLALNGEKDLQVAPTNLDHIRMALQDGGNKDVTIKEFPGMNHLFQECETGAVGEYVTIEQTMSPIVLDEITTWILKHTGKK